MNLKEMIKVGFDIDLPISGGSGNSITNAIKIHMQDSSQKVTMEYTVLNYIFKLRGDGYKIIKQALLTHNKSEYDKLTIELENGNLENYYFDISNNNEIKPDNIEEDLEWSDLPTYMRNKIKNKNT